MKPVAVLLLLSLSAPAAAQTWLRSHGGQDNAGFADVATSPATAANAKTLATGIGAFKPGVGPVIGTNGDVYLATADGRLIAVGANDVTRWTATLPAGRQIFASPLAATDSSVYVVSSAGLTPGVNDHRTSVWLTKFTQAGGKVWERPIPVHGVSSGTGLALNSIGALGAEMFVVASSAYSKGAQATVAITGFNRSGAQQFDQVIGGMTEGPATYKNNESGWACIIDQACWWGMPEIKTQKPPPTVPDSTLPADRRFAAGIHGSGVGIAIANNVIVVSDGYRGVRGYQFVGGVLSLVFEKLGDLYLTSAPAALPDLHTVYANYPGRIAFAGPNAEVIADMWHSLDHHEVSVESAPTRLANGNVVSVDRDGRVTIVQHVTPIVHVATGEQSIASASASRNFYYVSTLSGLHTFDTTTNQEVGVFSWSDGGQSSPAIGADGSVYALAGEALFRFSPASSAHGQVRDHRTGLPPAQPTPQPKPQPHPQPATTRDHRSQD